MDDLHFDALTRGLAFPGTRRRLLAGVAALPVVGGLLGILETDEAAAGRRKRRKKRHKHGKGRRRTHKPGRKKPKCTPESAAQTCAGRCGSVTNTCGQAVDCGSCVCDPPCGICQTCDPQSGACIPDPEQQGDACGKPGQVCQPDGTCWCDATSCGVCRSCHRSGECTNPCRSAGCCDGETCQPGLDNNACGNGGITCDVCTGQEQCQVNEQNEYLCTCVPDCTGQPCGGADGCGGVCQTQSCDQCQTCQAGQCVAADAGTACDVDGLCLQSQSTCDGLGHCIETRVVCQDSTQNCCMTGVYAGECRRLGGAPCTVGAQCCSDVCSVSGWCD